MILDGVLKEGDPLPSVRNVAAEYRVNPLTVLRATKKWWTSNWWKAGEAAGCHQRRRTEAAAGGERKTFLFGRVAACARNDSAAWIDAGRAAESRREREAAGGFF